MKLRFILPALWLGPLLSAPALAEEPEYSTRETRVLMHEDARCVVNKRPAKASQALLSNVDSGTILRRYKMLIVEECLAGQGNKDTLTMSFAGDLYQYALADALVNQELAAKPIPELLNVPRLDQRAPGEPPRQIAANGKKLSARKYDEALKSHNKRVAWSFLGRYGECVVRVDPAGAKALLLTKPDSEDEAARFSSLRPVFGECLPEGRTLEFGKVTLRGTIAVNYYRLAHAAAGKVAG